MLSTKQKQKIEEEEEYRAQVRGERKEKEKSSRGKGCLTVVLIFITMGIIGSALSNSSGGNVNKKTDFKASAYFTGTQFVISNEDSQDCQSARVIINITWNGGYTLEGYNLEKGQTYTVGAGQFTLSDGTRLNPFTTKPKSISITCQGNNELNGATYIGNW